MCVTHAVLQIDNERLPILRNALEVKDIREGKTGRLKAPSGSPRKTEVTFQLLPFSLASRLPFIAFC